MTDVACEVCGDSTSLIEHDYEGHRYRGCEVCHHVVDIGEATGPLSIIARLMREASEARDQREFVPHSGGYRDAAMLKDE